MQRIGPDVAELKRMYVQPAHRHGGLGRALVDELVAMVRTSGYRRIWLDSPDCMTAATECIEPPDLSISGRMPGLRSRNRCGPDGCSWSDTWDPTLPTEARPGHDLVRLARTING